MRYKLLILGVACWALTGTPLVAQNVGTGIEPTGASRGHQTGTRGANFLRIGPSPRARALADAGTVLTGGATVLFYNPAAAALSERFELAGSYTDLYSGSGLKHAFLGAILPVGDAGAVGIHTLVFSSGEIQATTELSPNGFDPVIGNIVEWSSVALGVTYAHRITDRLALGGTVKYVQEGIDFAHVNFWGFDIGTVFETGLYGTRLAASIQNLGGESRFEGPATTRTLQSDLRYSNDLILGSDLNVRLNTDKMEMPTTFRFALMTPMFGVPEAIFGLPSTSHKLDFLLEVNDGFDTDLEPRIGLEYGFKQILFLRAGKHWQNESDSPWSFSDGLAFGAGLRTPFLGDEGYFGLDYSYTAMGILDNVQTFGFELGF
jgi:hypothetical protein